MTTTFDQVQAELDELQAAYEAAILNEGTDGAAITALQAQLATANQNLAAAAAHDTTDHATIATLQGQVGTLTTNLASANAALTVATSDDAADTALIAALRAEIVALKAAATPPPPPPTPTPVRTRLMGFSGNATKVAGACERWFDGAAGITLVPARRSKANCPRVHDSWKILGDPKPTNAQLVAAFAHLLDDDKVEVEHEADVKYRKAAKTNAAAAQTELNNRLGVKNAFFDQVVALRTLGDIPDVDVVATWSVWSFASNGPKDFTKYTCRADVLGVDVDGDDASAGGYTDYTQDPACFERIIAFAASKFGGRWTIPEHSWNNTKVGERMPWFKKCIPFLMNYNPEELMIFDASGFAPLLTSGELTELAVLVHKYND